jgi:carbamoyltransferase
MKILGIQKHHSSSVCLLDDCNIIYFNQEERLSRHKKDSGFPFHCIVEIAKKAIEIDVLVLTGYETYTGEDRSIIGLIQKLGIRFAPNFTFYHQNRNHHLSHAANAFYNSGFDDAAIIVWDGRGSTFALSNGYSAHETTTVFTAEYPNKFQAIYKRLYTPRPIDADTKVILDNGLGSAKELWPQWYTKNSEITIRNDFDLGLMYHGMSICLGFDDEGGKMLGLSAYGKDNPEFPSFIDKHGIFDMTKHKFQSYGCNGHVGFNWEQHSQAQYNPNTGPDLAYRTQKDLEKYGLEFIKKTLQSSGKKNLILTGGVSLNVVANNFYKKNLPDDINLYVEPMCGDEANCIGMAKYFYHEVTKSNAIYPLKNIYLCGETPAYDYQLLPSETEYSEVVEKQVAELIQAGNVVAIFQGKAESGPRALGNRSILFDPRISNGKDIINKIKGREYFRPFAASILEEYADSWFEMRNLVSSPFMMFAFDAKNIAKNKTPAVIHIDGTCRIQTVNEVDNPIYYKIIKEFYNLTEIPLIMNTSFNLSTEPIVHTIENALKSCRTSGISYLYLPDIKKLVKFI